MRKLLLIAFLGLSWSGLVAQEDETEPPVGFEILGSLGGGLIWGERVDLIAQSLSPRPLSTQDTTLGAEVRWYFTENWGLDGGATLATTTVFRPDPGYLSVMGRVVVSVGPRGRWVYPLGYASSLSIHGGLGLNQGWTAYTDEYASLFYPEYELYDLLPGVGYYAKVGGQFTPGRPFFVGGDLVYEHLGGQVSKTHRGFSADLLQARFYVGMGF